MGDTSVEERLLAQRHGSTARIIFNNPARHNAVSLDMWQRMAGLVEAFAADESVRVLVVTGAGGKAFVSGADISKFESERASQEAVAIYNATSARVYEALYTFPKPTIAEIQGFCIGGGVNLAVCCDLRFASASARFGIPAARLGLGYGYPGVRRLADIVGQSRAMELFYTARKIDAEEALRIGLVNAVVADSDLASAVAETAETIARNAPLTVRTIKAVVGEIRKPEAARDHGKLDAMVAACFNSSDYKEGRAAFMEKREPKFIGE